MQKILSWAALAPMCLSIVANAAEPTSPIAWQTYLDAGYSASNLDPEGNAWPNKGTTATVNEPELNLAMASIWKQATQDSRWGFEFGLQTGADSESLVTSAPPPANVPVNDADKWRHLYRANVSYLLGEEHEVRVTGGLINSYIGYESYLAIDNPNYTRGYLLDNVPYFLVGLGTDWNVSDKVDLSFYLTTGYNYLTDPNDTPSTGMKLKLQITPNTRFIQNIYYGPDQEQTSIEYWRFFSDSIIEWRNNRFLVAAAIDYGTETQAWLPNEPRVNWGAGAVWAQWMVNDRVSLALRPEIYKDSDGLMTGTPQTIRAITATAKFSFFPARQRITAMLEARYDHSNADAGMFSDGSPDNLKADQFLLLLGFLWSFDG